MSRNRKNMLWHDVAGGRMSKEMQQLFEKAQRLAIDTGVKVPVTLTLTVNPPRKGEPDYISVAYTKVLKEPTVKSKEYDLVLDMSSGVAVVDAAEPEKQVDLELDSKNGGAN